MSPSRLQPLPVSFETILDYLVDFIQIVGCPQLYEEKTQVISIKDYKGLLPCNYVSMIQVRNAPPPDDHIADDYPGIRRHSAYRYAGDSFHMSPDKPDVGRGGTDLTYKIQGCIIYTSTKDKPIEIAYHAIATDPEGYPLIPDNPSFMRAFCFSASVMEEGRCHISDCCILASFLSYFSQSPLSLSIFVFVSILSGVSFLLIDLKRFWIDFTGSKKASLAFEVMGVYSPMGISL